MSSSSRGRGACYSGIASIFATICSCWNSSTPTRLRDGTGNDPALRSDDPTPAVLNEADGLPPALIEATGVGGNGSAHLDRDVRTLSDHGYSSGLSNLK